jgi:hypothetical protein
MFTRWSGDDFDPAFEGIGVIHKKKVRFSAAEELGEHLLKILSDLFKRV